MANTWLIKVTLDRLARSLSGADVITLGAAFAGLSFFGAALLPLPRYLQASLNRSLAIGAKDRLYTAVGRLNLLSTLEEPRFRDRLRLAEQASRQAPGQIIGSVLGVTRAAVTLLGMLTAIILVSPWLAVLLVVSGLPAVIAQTRLSRGRATLLWQLSPAERREAFYSELLTNLQAAKEIRLFGSGLLLHRRMLRELAVNDVAHERQDRRELASQTALAALSAAFAGGALAWLVVLARQGSVTIGAVAAAIVAAAAVLTSLSTMVSQIAMSYGAWVTLEHYRELVTVAPDIQATTCIRQPGGEPVAGIECVDVWFRYGEEQPWVLSGLNLSIPFGQTVAIVGENGAGKSTLVKLLCRFYEPARGAIRWNGVDIRDIPVADLRRRIGVVFQDFMAYEMTARDNIALGDVDGRPDLDVDDGRLGDAAGRAEVLDTILNLPMGWDTMLSRTFVNYADAGVDGVLPSGGQWQRLALARALYRGQRDLLILDEPSSGLDAVAEHRIHRQLAKERAGRTSILISHRLGSVRDADDIIVLAGGKVGERGTHGELLAADGTYAQLFRLQAAGYEPEARVP